MGCVSLFVLLLISLSVAYGQDESEVCQFEAFTSSCESGLVSHVYRASYGRMSLGRCVKRDFGFLGCYSDVTNQLTAECTASINCSYNVARLPSLVQPCPPDLMSYLYVKHSCLKVVNSAVCTLPRPLKVESSSGYIASVYTSLIGSASSQCPVYIKAAPYQTINITVTSYSSRQQTPDDMKNCEQSIVFQGKDFLQKDGLCTYVEHHYAFEGELYTHFSGKLEDSMRFLLHFKVLGCAAPKLHGNAVFEQLSKTRGRVQCGTTFWYITCDGSSWIGHIGNCSENDDTDKNIVFNEDKSNETNDDTALPFGWLLLIVGGFLLGLVLLSCPIALLLFCQQRRRRNLHQPQEGQKLFVREPCVEEKPANNFVKCRSAESLTYCMVNQGQHKASPKMFHSDHSPYGNKYCNKKSMTLAHGAKLSPKPSQHSFSTFRPVNDKGEDIYSMYQRRGLLQDPNNSLLNSGDYNLSQDTYSHRQLRPDLIENTTDEANPNGKPNNKTIQPPLPVRQSSCT